MSQDKYPTVDANTSVFLSGEADGKFELFITSLGNLGDDGQPGGELDLLNKFFQDWQNGKEGTIQYSFDILAVVRQLTSDIDEELEQCNYDAALVKARFDKLRSNLQEALRLLDKSTVDAAVDERDAFWKQR